MPSDIDKTTPVSDLALMERYGISRTPADYFHYGQYRYTNLQDAIAQAERDKLRTLRQFRLGVLAEKRIDGTSRRPQGNCRGNSAHRWDSL